MPETIEKAVMFDSLIQKVKDYQLLIKLKLALLVVFSAAMSYIIVTPHLDWAGLGILSLGGLLITGAANALNQVLEKDYDKLMERTKNRPIAAGRMSVGEAVLAAGLMSVTGILLLAMFNPLTAMLGAVSLISYSFVYTPMKRVSPVAVIIGAFPGAFPVMIGCVAGEGEITLVALVLFTIQFLWQFPHFWAIAWVGYEDYAKAGFYLLPNKKKDKSAGLQSFIYALLLLLAGTFPYYMGLTGITSLIIVGIMGGIYTFYSFRFFKECTREAALKVMFTSFAYLPIVLIALVLDKL